MVTIRGPPLNARAPQEDINYDVCTVGRIPLEECQRPAGDPHSGVGRRPLAPSMRMHRRMLGQGRFRFPPEDPSMRRPSVEAYPVSRGLPLRLPSQPTLLRYRGSRLTRGTGSEVSPTKWVTESPPLLALGPPRADLGGLWSAPWEGTPVWSRLLEGALLRRGAP